MLNKEPFSYRSTKSGVVHIAYQGKTITSLSAKEASRFIAKVESGDREDAQLTMAKATGHFKHGNERESKERRKNCDSSG